LAAHSLGSSIIFCALDDATPQSSKSGDPYEEILVNLGNQQKQQASEDTKGASKKRGRQQGKQTSSSSIGQANEDDDMVMRRRYGNIPSLYQLCVRTVADNMNIFAPASGASDSDEAVIISHDEDAGGVGMPEQLVGDILRQVLASSDLTYEIVESLSFSGCGALLIPDCSKINELFLGALIKKVSNATPGHGLNTLRLIHVGTCFTDKVGKDLIATHTNTIEHLQLTGLYKLHDDVFAKLLEANKKSLVTVDLSHCHLATFGPQTLEALGNIAGDVATSPHAHHKDAKGHKKHSSSSSSSSSSSAVSASSHSRLQELTLNYVTCIGDGENNVIDIKQLFSQSIDGVLTPRFCPSLHVLSLEGLPLLTDNCVETMLASVGAQLSSLNISSCPALTDKSVLSISQHCRQLESLNIANLLEISTNTLLTLFGGATANSATATADKDSVRSNTHYIGMLKNLNLCGLSAVTDYVIYYALQLPQHIQNENVHASLGLKTLNVSKCPQVTGKAAVAVALHCKHTLTHLDINFTRGFSELALGYLICECLQMHSINVFGCTQLSRDWVKKMRSIYGIKLVGLFMNE
jgi:hypothetical protein